MTSAKELRVFPIRSGVANAVVKRLHYSGKVVRNSQVHLGVFWRDRLEGVMQFGPPIDKRKVLPLVEGTAWGGMLELNRMAFGEDLPRNSESRALAIAFKMIRRANPQVEWILSFADATQCGDGAIYRASGFLLTDIRENNGLFRMPDGRVVHKLVFEPSQGGRVDKERYGKSGSGAAMSFLKRIGATPVPGFQLRYIRFLDAAARVRLTVPEIPFNEISRRGAAMYLGEQVTRSKQASAGPPASDGAAPIRPLQE